MIGGKAEEYAYPLLQEAYDTVIDLREDKEAQYHGIDFSIRQNSWKHAYTLDIKGNLHNGLFCFEFRKTYQHSNRVTPGWFHTSKSDRIYHVDVDNEQLVWYELPKMRMRLLEEETLTGYSDGLRRISIEDILIKDLLRTTW